MEGLESALRPTSIFPLEVWEMIVNKMGSVDRLNICRTNPELNIAFGDRKCEWLLGQVLPFLVQYMQHIPELLTCRSVCKQWRNAVDHFLEADHPSRRSFNPEHVIEKLNAKRATVYSLLKPEHVQISPANSQKLAMFPSSFSNAGSPKMIGRALSFELNETWDGNVVEEFLNTSKMFIELHGPNIWHFKFIQTNSRLNMMRFYLFLHSSLRFLPNLCTLEVQSLVDLLNDDGDPELISAIVTYPLPPLLRLDSIALDGLPAVIRDHFLAQYGGRIAKLSIELHGIAHLPIQLNELYLNAITNDDILSHLGAMTSVPLSCSKMTFDMGPCNILQAGSLLQMLARFPHLAHLRIILQERCWYMNMGCYSLNNFRILSVKYFEIEGDSRDVFNFTSLLRALPSLQYLHIRDTSHFPDHFGGHTGPTARNFDFAGRDSVEIKEFLSGDELCNSPIWYTLPHLDVLTFEKVDGTYKRNCNRQIVRYRRENNLINC